MRGMRTLSQRTAVLGGASNNSVQSCTDACLSLGYSLAGVEYGHECRTFYLSLRSAAHSRCFLKTAVPLSTVSLLRRPWLIVPCSVPEMAPSFVVVETALTCTTIPVPTKVIPPHPLALCRQQTFLEGISIRDAWRTYPLHF